MSTLPRMRPPNHGSVSSMIVLPAKVLKTGKKQPSKFSSVRTPIYIECRIIYTVSLLLAQNHEKIHKFYTQICCCNIPPGLLHKVLAGIYQRWSAMVRCNQHLVLTDHYLHLCYHYCFLYLFRYQRALWPTLSGNNIGNHVTVRSQQHHALALV